MHGGQRSVSLEYQTCTSAYLFDTLVTGMVLAESFDIDEKSPSIICSNCAISFLYKYHNYQPSFSCSLNFFKDNSNHKILILSGAYLNLKVKLLI